MMLNSMMNTNLIGMMSMKDNVSFYQILTGIILTNVMTFIPQIKQYNLFTNEAENVCEVCGVVMQIEADCCSDECAKIAVDKIFCKKS